MSSLSGAQYETQASPATPAAKAESAPRPANAGPGAAPADVAARDADAPLRIADLQREIALCRAAQGGDVAAYGQLVLAYQDRMYNAMLRTVGNVEEAQELTQEAFTRGLQKIDGFRGDASPYTWLFRIAMNLAISCLRKPHRKRTFSLDGQQQARRDGEDQASNLVDRVAKDSAPQPLEALERKERDQQVMAALGRLDPEHRAVLVMRDIEGFDYQQMADVLDMPLGTLKSRLFRARVALRNELLPYMG